MLKRITILHIVWYHLTDEIDILEGESFYFYFTASQDMIGAEYFISLDIIDHNIL